MAAAAAALGPSFTHTLRQGGGNGGSGSGGGGGERGARGSGTRMRLAGSPASPGGHRAGAERGTGAASATRRAGGPPEGPQEAPGAGQRRAGNDVYGHVPPPRRHEAMATAGRRSTGLGGGENGSVFLARSRRTEVADDPGSEIPAPSGTQRRLGKRSHLPDLGSASAFAPRSPVTSPCSHLPGPLHSFSARPPCGAEPRDASPPPET